MLRVGGEFLRSASVHAASVCKDNGGLPHPDAKRHFSACLLQGLGDGPSESLHMGLDSDVGTGSIRPLLIVRSERERNANTHLVVRDASDEGLLPCKTRTHAHGLILRSRHTQLACVLSSPRRSTLRPSPTPAAWTFTLEAREVIRGSTDRDPIGPASGAALQEGPTARVRICIG